MLGRVAMNIARSLLCPAAALLLASCVTHGQNQPREFLQTMPAELSELPYWKVFRNHSSHSEFFFRNLTFGRMLSIGTEKFSFFVIQNFPLWA